jgi:hypothetical protein
VIARRLLLAALAGTPLRSADDRTTALEAVAPLAAALSDNDADAFLRRISRDAPDYSKLRNNVVTLVAEADVTCSIEYIRREDGAYELDWYIQLRSKITSGVMERRHGVVKIVLDTKGKLKSLQPVDFFLPPRAEGQLRP